MLVARMPVRVASDSDSSVWAARLHLLLPRAGAAGALATVADIVGGDWRGHAAVRNADSARQSQRPRNQSVRTPARASPSSARRPASPTARVTVARCAIVKNASASARGLAGRAGRQTSEPRGPKALGGRWRRRIAGGARPSHRQPPASQREAARTLKGLGRREPRRGRIPQSQRFAQGACEGRGPSGVAQAQAVAPTRRAEPAPPARLELAARGAAAARSREMSLHGAGVGRAPCHGGLQRNPGERVRRRSRDLPARERHRLRRPGPATGPSALAGLPPQRQRRRAQTPALARSMRRHPLPVLRRGA